MAEVDVAAELFHPYAQLEWIDGRSVVPAEERTAVRTQVSGVRLRAADPKGEDPTAERETQADVVHLVASLRRLRTEPGLASLVLSGDGLRARDPLGAGARVKFGLAEAADGDDDVRAARRSHRAIVRAVRRAGLRVEHPRAFDAQAGLQGLERWGAELRLRRGWRPSRLLWLLPLLLLAVAIANCERDVSILGVGIDTANLIVVLDKSGSMQEEFERVRTEVARTLARMKSGFLRTCHVDLIVYDAAAESVLGGLTAADEAVAARLDAALAALQPAGGTALRPALELAAREIEVLGAPTTVVVYTDGEGDGTIRELLDGGPAALLGQVPAENVVVHTLTPRLAADGTPADPSNHEPVNQAEADLDALARTLGGRFGPLEEE